MRNIDYHHVAMFSKYTHKHIGKLRDKIKFMMPSEFSMQNVEMDQYICQFATWTSSTEEGISGKPFSVVPARPVWPKYLESGCSVFNNSLNQACQKNATQLAENGCRIFIFIAKGREVSQRSIQLARIVWSTLGYSFFPQNVKQCNILEAERPQTKI